METESFRLLALVSAFQTYSSLLISLIGVYTTYTRGQVVPMEVQVPVYHGGRFQFRIQDVGANADPDGSLWETLEPLIVESFSPLCDDPSHGCGPDPCLQEHNCALIPLEKYGEHNEKYVINVKLPDDLTCEHCVLQWHWLTGNSCWPDWVACEGSEEFWNCADLRIVNGTSSPATPTPAPTPLSPPPTLTPECSGEVGSNVCSGHGQVTCPANTCWKPVWEWPNDYCYLRADRKCDPWEVSQGGSSWEACCAYYGHCKGTGAVEPFPEQCQCTCFEGWSGTNCNECSFQNTTVPPPATANPTPAPVSDDDVVSNDDTNGCADACYSTTASSSWYYALVDAWCQMDCAHLTEYYPNRCVSGCRTDNTVSAMDTHATALPLASAMIRYLRGI